VWEDEVDTECCTRGRNEQYVKKKKIVVEPEAKGSPGRSRCRWESSIKMFLTEIGGNSVDWIVWAWG